MSRSTAWDIAGVSPGARSLAERAADRAGVTLERWLDEAIVEHAAEPRAAVDDAGGRAPFAGVLSARDLQERLKATAAPLARRADPPAGALPPSDAVSPPPGAPPPAPAPPGGAASESRLRAARPAAADARLREAFDLQSALAEIASRRRALDARLAHDGLGPTARRATDADGAEARAGESSSREFPAPLRPGIRDPGLRRDAAERGERAARSREGEFGRFAGEAAGGAPAPLPPLAPGAFAAGFPQTQPEEPARREESQESLLASVNRIALDLREALGGARPAPVADLDRRIDALGARIDALAGATVREEVVEAIRRQMEEVHDLLLAAARRSSPLQRLDEQISRLVDQVERLSAAPPALDAAQADALIALLGRPAETAALEPALVSIDARLADLAGRLDQDGAAERAALAAIAATLDATQPDSIPALIRDLAEAVHAQGGGPDRTGFAALPAAARPDDAEPSRLASIDAALEAIAARLAATASDDAADRLAEAVADRIESLHRERLDPALSGRLARIDGRLDLVASRLDDIDALERSVRDVLDRLRAADDPPTFDVAGEIAVLRRERTAADQRAETLLRELHDVIARLVDRISRDAREPPRSRQDGGERTPTIRIVDPAALDDLDALDPPRPPRRAPDVVPPEGPEDDRLLEPGAGAPDVAAADTVDAAQAPGARTSPAVSALIAAARRAAQSPLAGPGAPDEPAWPKVERNLRNAGRFCVDHKKALLVAAALALALAAAARIVTDHAFVAGETPRTAALATPRPALPAARAPMVSSTTVDVMPTGSIGPARTGLGGRSAGAPAAPPAIPAEVPPTLRDAVLAGSPAADYELAQRLVEGRGLDRDPAAAAVWFERAATAGLAPAAFRLGALYQKGVGVARDPVAAKRWYAQAALAGNARAAHNLGVMAAESSPDEKADYSEAARWFRKAAEMGVRDSQFNLGVLAARGLGVEPDLRQAWLWFSLAAAQGDAEAGRKRDEVAARMDADALAAARALLAQFRPIAPDPAANEAPAPPGPAAQASDRAAHPGL